MYQVPVLCCTARKGARAVRAKANFLVRLLDLAEPGDGGWGGYFCFVRGFHSLVRSGTAEGGGVGLGSRREGRRQGKREKGLEDMGGVVLVLP